MNFEGPLRALLLWSCLLVFFPTSSDAAGATGIATVAITPDYPQAALSLDSCYVSSSFDMWAATTSNACTVGGKIYRASFSSSDGRWYYNPRNIFDDSDTGYAGRWADGTYTCLSGTCTYTGTSGLNTDGDTGTPPVLEIMGEWVAIRLPVFVQLENVKIVGSSALAYMVYGGKSTDSGGTKLWTLLLTEDPTSYSGNVETGNVNANGVLTAPFAYYDMFAIVVTKTTTPTLTMMELYFEVFGCPVGTFLTTGASTCTQCDEGKYNPNVGSRAAADCLVCPAGKYIATPGAAACTDCVAGKFNADNTGDVNLHNAEATCTVCPIGKYGTGTGLTICSDCPAGKYGDTTTKTSIAQCTNCPEGKFLADPAKTAAADCVACTTIGATYRSAPGATVCADPCPAGTQPETAGTVNECTTCAIGEYSVPGGACQACANGKYAAAGSTTCTDCPLGTYGTGSIAKSSCTSCGVGKYTASTGRTVIADCLKCPPGTYQDQAVAGGLNMCKPCNPGYYSNLDVAANGADACTICPIGKFAPSIGQSMCFDCVGGKYADTTGSTGCKECPLTQNCAGGASVCAVCPT